MTFITSKVESDYLLISANAKVVINDEYQNLVKLYCDEIFKSGLTKIIIDETNVFYANSLLLQMDIVSFYSSGELPEEFATWKIACFGLPKLKLYYDFWEHLAQTKGYNQKAFTSLELAREFMNEK